MSAEHVHGLLTCFLLAGIALAFLTIASLCVAAARPRPTRHDKP